jgi:hypothetical protein
MYVRATSFEVDASRVPELSARIARMSPIAKTLPGVLDIYVAWRADGRGLVFAVYESEEAAGRAVARLQAVWGELANLLVSPPRTDIFDTAAHVAGG